MFLFQSLKQIKAMGTAPGTTNLSLRMTRYPLLNLWSILGTRYLLFHNHKAYVALMYSYKRHLEVLTSHKVRMEVLISSRNNTKMLLMQRYTRVLTIYRMYCVVLHRTTKVMRMET